MSVTSRLADGEVLVVAFEDGAAEQVDVLGGEGGGDGVDADAAGSHPVLAQITVCRSRPPRAGRSRLVHGFQPALHLRLGHLPQVRQAVATRLVRLEAIRMLGRG